METLGMRYGEIKGGRDQYKWNNITRAKGRREGRKVEIKRKRDRE